MVLFSLLHRFVDTAGGHDGLTHAVHNLLVGGKEQKGDENGRPVRGTLRREAVVKVSREKGKLPLGAYVRYRVRYFCDGAVLGSREFVEGMFFCSGPGTQRRRSGPSRDPVEGSNPLVDVAAMADVMQVDGPWCHVELIKNPVIPNAQSELRPSNQPPVREALEPHAHLVHFALDGSAASGGRRPNERLKVADQICSAAATEGQGWREVNSPAAISWRDWSRWRLTSSVNSS